jgi:hypothetical protein
MIYWKELFLVAEIINKGQKKAQSEKGFPSVIQEGKDANKCFKRFSGIPF